MKKVKILDPYWTLVYMKRQKFRKNPVRIKPKSPYNP